MPRDKDTRIKRLSTVLRLAAKYIETGGRDKDEKLRITVLYRIKEALKDYGDTGKE